MTRPVETQRSSGPSHPDLGALVADVRGLLEVWQDIFRSSAAWVPAQIEVLRRQSQSLEPRAREAGADALCQQLVACAQCLEESPVDRPKLGRCLRSLSELAWRLKEQARAVDDSEPVTPPEPDAVVPAPSTPVLAQSARVPPSPIIALHGAGTSAPAPAPPVPRPARALGEREAEPPSLQDLLQLGSASLAPPSPPPPPAGTPGTAEIEGFPISERPGAIEDIFAAGEAPGGVTEPRLSPAPTADSEAPGRAPGVARTTLPFGAPALGGPPPMAPALVPVAPPGFGDAQAGGPALPLGAPAFEHPRAPESAVPLPEWAHPRVGGIRWGLVLAIVGAVGGMAALLVSLEMMAPSPAQVGPQLPGLAGTTSDGPAGAAGNALNDAEFAALRSRAHGFGSFESPQLAALLDAEADAVRHAATPTCPAGSVGCDPNARGRGVPSYRPVGGSQPVEPASVGAWLANLRRPGIGVSDDSRVRALFQFHTEHAVGREMFQGTLFQCGADQARIREVLLRHDVPLDLTALAMVASGCVADVESATGARGLWQLSPLTARAYGLKIIPGVLDQRLDPLKSTEVAVRVLADLRRKTGSWESAAAGFGLGPFELLTRMVGAAEPFDFWRLADSDPLLAESAGFVAKVQAYALILSNLDRYQFRDAPSQPLEETARLEVPPGTSLGMVARAAGTSITRVRELNPELLGSSVPLELESDLAVRVPQARAARASEKLLDLIREADGAEQCVPHHFDWGRQRFTRRMAYRCRRAAR